MAARRPFSYKTVASGTVCFSGELTIFSAKELQAVLLRLKKKREPEVLDLKGVKRLDGAAAQIFRALQKSLDRPLQFRNVPEVVRQNLVFVGFNPEQFERD